MAQDTGRKVDKTLDEQSDRIISAPYFTERKVSGIMGSMSKRLQFSDQLRRLILRSHKSRYVISKEIDLGESALSRFVNGHSGISIDSIDKICDCLDLRLVATEAKKRSKKGS